MPYLAQLAEDDEFVAKLEKVSLPAGDFTTAEPTSLRLIISLCRLRWPHQMKKEQDELEQSLWREREALIKAGRENVDRAKKVYVQPFFLTGLICEQLTRDREPALQCLGVREEGAHAVRAEGELNFVVSTLPVASAI